MIVNTKTGRIAYHSLTLKDDGGLEFNQYDYDGRKLDRLLVPEEESMLFESLDTKE